MLIDEISTIMVQRKKGYTQGYQCPRANYVLQEQALENMRIAIENQDYVTANFWRDKANAIIKHRTEHDKYFLRNTAKMISHDNGKDYNYGSRNSFCYLVRVPSMKRSNAQWRNFYKLFPTYYDIMRGWRESYEKILRDRPTFTPCIKLKPMIIDSLEKRKEYYLQKKSTFGVNI